MSCGKGEQDQLCWWTQRMSGPEPPLGALQRSTHRSWCHQEGLDWSLCRLEKLLCKSLSPFCILAWDSNPQRGSELKWSWWNARGRDSTQVVTTSTAWSGLTSFLAVQGNGEEQPLWVSSCFVVGTEQSISESLHQQTSAHQTHLQSDYFLLICSKAADKRQGMGEGKMKGRRSVEEEARLATSVTCFCCCLASLHHFFCSLI